MSARRSIYIKLALFSTLGAALVLAIHAALFILQPASDLKEYKEVLVTEGMSFRAVAGELRDQGLVTDKATFIVLGRLKGVTRKIRAGFYSLNTGMRPLDILDVLRRGKIIEYQVVLPEGSDMEKVAEALAGTKLVTKEEFLSRACSPGYVKSLGLAGGTLEGYLFPATYFFPKGTTPDAMIKQMVSKYRTVFNEQLKSRAAELGMTELEALTLASLVEREAKLDSERALVSAVFHNRLKTGMPLQCDPCVIYALERRGKWHGDLNKENLRFKDPYNTYVYRGLPPGPIANPGRPSILAALYPAAVDYVYFVSKNDGTHFFSNNLTAHNRAVHEYQVLAGMKNRTSSSPRAEKRP